MDELTRITVDIDGYTIATGHGFILAENASLVDALRALWHRGLTPLARGRLQC